MPIHHARFIRRLTMPRPSPCSQPDSAARSQGTQDHSRRPPTAAEPTRSLAALQSRRWYRRHRHPRRPTIPHRTRRPATRIHGGRPSIPPATRTPHPRRNAGAPGPHLHTTTAARMTNTGRTRPTTATALSRRLCRWMARHAYRPSWMLLQATSWPPSTPRGAGGVARCQSLASPSKYLEPHGSKAKSHGVDSGPNRSFRPCDSGPKRSKTARNGSKRAETARKRTPSLPGVGNEFRPEPSDLRAIVRTPEAPGETGRRRVRAH
jgi:hypothetical protein